VARGSSLHITRDTLSPGIKGFDAKLQRGVDLIIGLFVPRVEGYARTHAPWTDRTGNARNGLRATAYEAGAKHGIVIFHSVPYGIWLEVRFEGRYGIIDDTIRTQGEELMSAFRYMVGSL